MARLAVVTLLLAGTMSQAAAGHCPRPHYPGDDPVRVGQRGGHWYAGMETDQTYLYADGSSSSLEIYGFIPQTPRSAPIVIYLAARPNGLESCGHHP